MSSHFDILAIPLSNFFPVPTRMHRKPVLAFIHVICMSSQGGVTWLATLWCLETRPMVFLMRLSAPSATLSKGRRCSILRTALATGGSTR